MNLQLCNLGFRICVTCKQEKALTSEFFYRDKNRKDGLMYRCKYCDKSRKDNRTGRYEKLSEEQKKKHYILGVKYRKTPKGKAISTLKAYQRIDKNKSLICDLTQEDLINIDKKPCTYCGFPSTGFDRINNSIGHLKSNCVPACKECNIARMDNFSHEEMFIIGKTIKEIKIARL